MRSDHVDGSLIDVVANAAATDSTTTAAPLSTAAALVLQPGGDRSDIGHLDVGLATAQRRDFRC